MYKSKDHIREFIKINQFYYTLEEIADELGITHAAVRYHADQLGIKLQTNKKREMESRSGEPKKERVYTPNHSAPVATPITEQERQGAILILAEIVKTFTKEQKEKFIKRWVTVRDQIFIG